MALGTSTEGISICPETAACIGAVEQLAAEKWIDSEERVVIFNTGAAQKYPEAMAVPLPEIDKDAPLDWERIAGVSAANLSDVGDPIAEDRYPCDEHDHPVALRLRPPSRP